MALYAALTTAVAAATTAVVGFFIILAATQLKDKYEITNGQGHNKNILRKLSQKNHIVKIQNKLAALFLMK